MIYITTIEHFTGKIRITDILRDHSRRFLAWKSSLDIPVREAVRHHIARALACRTPLLGAHVYRCEDCGVLRIVPHSCKSPFCSSCGTARTESWCRVLLSDLLEVPYRHLIFTIPYQLRLPIMDNRQRLIQVMFRAAADSILALTNGNPRPLCRKGRERMDRCGKRYLPGIQVGLHSFGSDIKWNPHLHMMVTAGGLAPSGAEWIDAPDRSLVSGVELSTEWKLRVIMYIDEEHRKNPLVCRRLKNDGRRRVDIKKLLGYIRGYKWQVRIGPALEDPSDAVAYCARYTRRPALGETRIEGYDGRFVTFRYKDYYKDGKRSYMKLPVLDFIDRLVQHIPEMNARHFRYYGIFATRVKTALLPKARSALEQRKRPRPARLTWEQQRKRAGEKEPLACPECGGRMRFYRRIFGSSRMIAEIIGCKPNDQIPYQTYLPKSRLQDVG